MCTVLYAAMCATLTGMVYYADVDVNAPFADAFNRNGMEWATEIVSLGKEFKVFFSFFLAKTNLSLITK